MKQYNTDIQGAMSWVESRCNRLVTDFLATRDSLPSWGPEVDAQVRLYVDILGYWVRAGDSWSFEGERYFGKDGLKTQKSRVVTLRPKKAMSAPSSQAQTREETLFPVVLLLMHILRKMLLVFRSRVIMH
jgi:hypothetical protein